MRYNPISSSLYKRNRKKLATRLKPNSIVIIHSNDQFPKNGDQLHRFQQNANLLYLSGLEQEKTILILFPDAPYEKYREMAFIIRPDEKLETWEGKKYRDDEASEISGLKNIYWIDQFEGILSELMTYSENIYLDQNEYTKSPDHRLMKNIRFAHWMKEKYPNHNYCRLAPIFLDLRVRKEPEEIEMLKKAVEITGKAFERVLKYVKPGIHEFEIEAEIDHEFKINRAIGHAYDPIIAFGKNALALHYISNNDQCIENEMILLDFGANYANYAADLSRTIPVNGRFSKRQRQIYQSVLKVLQESMKLFRPGSSIDQVNKTTASLIEKELVDLGLISMNEIKQQNKDNPVYKKYFMHGVSHFIGLDVHDMGHKFTPFEEGMVLSCEPGIYIKEESIGVRLENDVLITKQQPVNLMDNIPIDPDEIEDKMKQ